MLIARVDRIKVLYADMRKLNGVIHVALFYVCIAFNVAQSAAGNVLSRTNSHLEQSVPCLELDSRPNIIIIIIIILQSRLK